MPSEVDTSAWSGEGAFTQLLIERLRGMDTIRLVRVEDAPATRSEADYNFVSNEVFVAFVTRERQQAIKWFGFLPGTRTVSEKAWTLGELERALTQLFGGQRVELIDTRDVGHGTAA
jgi:hypothetical protein